jgi:hypothetical protein
MKISLLGAPAREARRLPRGGLKVENSTLGQTGGQLRALSRELKNGEIFNSRAAQPSQVLDFIRSTQRKERT